MRIQAFIVLFLFLGFLVLIGCGAKANPQIKDPCRNAPTECWGDKGINPNDIPTCVELIKCHSWEMSAS